MRLNPVMILNQLYVKFKPWDLINGMPSIVTVPPEVTLVKSTCGTNGRNAPLVTPQTLSLGQKA